METEDKTKINLETEETKERDKGSPRVSMEKEEKLFHDYRRKWEKSWSSKFGRCGRFEDTTLLSPMHFTYCAPGRNPYAASTGRTLQFYSIKVAEIKKALGLTWPLDVYGVVAARDNVDRNRNIIFLRGRDDCQTLTQKDPFLRLTGPSRAIVTRDPIHLEIELKAKGRTKSEDRVLMTDTWYYRDNYCGLCTLYTPLVTNLCTIVLSSEELEESVQATIVGVRIVEGSLPAKKKDSSPPFKYGCRVVCSSTPLNGILPDSQHITEPSFRQVVLQDGAMSVCKDGYLDLARHVVSVELGRRLKVIVYAYSRSGDIAPRGHIFFDAQKSK
ncbi:uncharacterized protein LOC124666491 [Lolium rigidum]|uniref:uncharacterized protein LOC124666491 n=1 Tax=Lolium rigidum TaxID=89674 RepID=UPI001F5C27C2|nr:uncharacterized protein LOC124666491 [Lolium rigidum]